MAIEKVFFKKLNPGMTFEWGGNKYKKFNNCVGKAVDRSSLIKEMIFNGRELVLVDSSEFVTEIDEAITYTHLLDY